MDLKEMGCGLDTSAFMTVCNSWLLQPCYETTVSITSMMS